MHEKPLKLWQKVNYRPWWSKPYAGGKRHNCMLDRRCEIDLLTSALKNVLSLWSFFSQRFVVNSGELQFHVEKEGEFLLNLLLLLHFFFILKLKPWCKISKLKLEWTRCYSNSCTSFMCSDLRFALVDLLFRQNVSTCWYRSLDWFFCRSFFQILNENGLTDSEWKW